MEMSERNIEQILQELEQRRFYGSLEIKFEAGRMVLIKKTETIKPNDYRNNRGKQHDQQQ